MKYPAPKKQTKPIPLKPNINYCFYAGYYWDMIKEMFDKKK